ncbi:MAG TPA: DUF2844 domain-containing protein [Candidatus Acidoferrales bacterium]|jgi:hypothetical protein|nr:DUF2844 domain-containing protein [Candidatus Acidoferrales bacterium]
MKLHLKLAMEMCLVAFTCCLTAHASLGGDMASVHNDQAKLQGTLQTTNKSSYDVHEIQGTSGVVVREYVSRSGAVFGVSWQGRTHPDLRLVLGSSYDQYIQEVQAQRAQRHGHGPLLIQTPGLVVQTGGHMGALTGKAFIPQNLPAGVRPEDIQ